jgi:hypothetical protein
LTSPSDKPTNPEEKKAFSKRGSLFGLERTRTSGSPFKLRGVAELVVNKSKEQSFGSAGGGKSETSKPSQK